MMDMATMALVFLGSITLIYGLLGLAWSTKNLLNIVWKTAFLASSFFGGIGFYVSMASGYWMGTNIFLALTALFALWNAFTWESEDVTNTLFKTVHWMFAISALGMIAVTLVS